MGALLNLKHPGAYAARRHPAIAGKRVMARGEFSAVYDNGDTILKLTCDEYHYMMLNDNCAKCEGPHFPRVVRDYGEVGEVFTTDFDRRGRHRLLYLFEMEKLVGIKRGKHIKTVRTIRHETAGCDGSLVTRLDHFADRLKSYPSLADAFVQLSRFVGLMDSALAQYGELDLHAGNYMVRPSTGELVLSDPIAMWNRR